MSVEFDELFNNTSFCTNFVEFDEFFIYKLLLYDCSVVEFDDFLKSRIPPGIHSNWNSGIPSWSTLRSCKEYLNMKGALDLFYLFMLLFIHVHK